MITHKEIFRHVRFAGDLVGRGRVIVSPGQRAIFFVGQGCMSLSMVSWAFRAYEVPA